MRHVLLFRNIPFQARVLKLLSIDPHAPTIAQLSRDSRTTFRPAHGLQSSKVLPNIVIQAPIDYSD